METYPDKAWDRCFNLNVRTVFNLTRACLPLLDKGSQEDDPGRVINIGSIAGLSFGVAIAMALACDHSLRAQSATCPDLRLRCQ